MGFAQHAAPQQLAGLEPSTVSLSTAGEPRPIAAGRARVGIALTFSRPAVHAVRNFLVDKRSLCAGSRRGYRGNPPRLGKLVSSTKRAVLVMHN